MHVRWLGWAGVELEHEGETVVIDPLADPAGTFAAFGDAARDVELPSVTPAAAGRAVAGLVSHLHRDHADAGALAAAIAPGAAVHHPTPTEEGNLALAQADYELGEAKLARRAVAAWASVTVGPFTCIALPAVDGLGDPQVSWLVEAGGSRVLHLGDTVFHGRWWQMARRAGPFDVVFARSTARSSTSPTSSRPARCPRPWSLSRPRLRASSSEREPWCRCTTAASPSSHITGRSPMPASGSSMPRAAGPTARRRWLPARGSDASLWQAGAWATVAAAAGGAQGHLVVRLATRLTVVATTPVPKT
ncbi:MAG: hypothetical protein JWQ48_418 [Conexibacter sp.]|nr:hypothetical protein [Conexibacter sp.]